MENIFLDTDVGFDCDDVGALSILNHLHQAHLCKIVAINHACSLNEKGPEAIQAVEHFYGLDDIKIGYCDSDKSRFLPTLINPYNAALIQKFGEKKNDKFIPSTKLIIDTLLSYPDHSVTYVCIGMLTNLAKAYQFFDEEKKIYGKELLNRKLKEIVIMGGDFVTSEPEFNIVMDTSSAQTLLKEAEVKVSFLDFPTGATIKTGYPLIEKYHLSNPVSLSYQLFINGNRESWDPLTVLYASKVYPELYRLTGPGVIQIHSDGKTTFQLDRNGKHYLIGLQANNSEITDKINSCMEGNL